jgi:hypothetical protein
LLAFPAGALVHFAVSHHHVRMSTRLAGAGAAFLPFDLGDSGAAGNLATGPEGATKLPNSWTLLACVEIICLDQYADEVHPGTFTV